MGLLTTMALPWVKAFDFSGRSSRAEWLLFFPTHALVVGLVLALNAILNWAGTPYPGLLDWLNAYVFLAFIPQMTLDIRRLHDTNRTGWWQLILVVPLIGIFVLLWWWLSAGDDQPNDYGNPPEPLWDAPPPGSPAAHHGQTTLAQMAARRDAQHRQIMRPRAAR